MPNYCNNYLRIKGSVAELQRLLRDGKSDKYALDFDLLYPNKVGTTEWECENWGCGDPSVEDLNTEDDKDYFTNFDTSWSPPLQAFGYLSSVYDLEFVLDYEELGTGFWGVANIAKGTVEDNSWEGISQPGVPLGKKLTEQEIKHFRSLVTLDEPDSECDQGDCILVEHSSITGLWDVKRDSENNPYKYEFDSGTENMPEVFNQLGKEGIDYICKIPFDATDHEYYEFEQFVLKLFKDKSGGNIFDEWVREI